VKRPAGTWKKALANVVLSLSLIAAGSSAALAVDSSAWVTGVSGKPLSEVTVAAGSGLYGDEIGFAADARFRSPEGIAVLPSGGILVADTENQVIKLVRNGVVAVYAGLTFEVDQYGLPLGGLVDGTRQLSVFQLPAGLAVNAAGNIYVAEAGNHVIRKIDTSGNVSVFAGSPIGALGDADGRGTEARFHRPSAVAVDPSGNVYVADTLNHTIRKIAPDGTVTTLNARSERVVEVFPGVVETAGDFRDGPIDQALFNEPSGLALDAKGNLFVSDTGNQRIRYIDFSAGTVTTVAGSPEVVYPDGALYAEGDYIDGAAAEAAFHGPRGLAVTPEGGLLIADSLNNALRYLIGGRVVTILGDGADGRSGTAAGTEAQAGLHRPTDVAVTADGGVLIADTYNNRIVKLALYRLPAGLAKDGSIHVIYAGSEIEFDAKPRNVNNRVLVPVRAVAETLGYTVETDDNVNVVLTKGDVNVRLVVGSRAVIVTSGTTVARANLDVAPFISEDRTYVPIRFISEQLGLQVDWNQEYRTVIIR